MSGSLDRDALLRTAIEQTGLDDVGDVPYTEALDVLIASWERDARLDERGYAAVGGLVVQMFAKRLGLVNDRRQNPGIADERIVAPVFIVGLPRTGSTHLHALMAQVTGARTPMFWEMSMPSPPPSAETFTTDPRVATVQAMVDQLPDSFQQRHPLAAMRPEQCNGLMDWSFINQAWTAMWEISSYRDWIYSIDYAPAFEAHRRMLQHLQWQVPGTWVLKYPKHMLALDALVRAYPDARFVWTHRDPGVVIPSVLSLTSFYRSQNPSYDPLLFGREWATLEEVVTARGMAARDRIPGMNERSIDVHFADLMRDPHGTVEAICDHAGLGYDAGSRVGVQRWLDDHPRTKHGEHRYTAEEFGLDAERLRQRFASYIERFNVPLERKG
jgi:Sulfotransferase family